MAPKARSSAKAAGQSGLGFPSPPASPNLAPAYPPQWIAPVHPPGWIAHGLVMPASEQAYDPQTYEMEDAALIAQQPAGIDNLPALSECGRYLNPTTFRVSYRLTEQNLDGGGHFGPLVAAFDGSLDKIQDYYISLDINKRKSFCQAITTVVCNGLDKHDMGTCQASALYKTISIKNLMAEKYINQIMDIVAASTTATVDMQLQMLSLPLTPATLAKIKAALKKEVHDAQGASSVQMICRNGVPSTISKDLGWTTVDKSLGVCAVLFYSLDIQDTVQLVNHLKLKTPLISESSRVSSDDYFRSIIFTFMMNPAYGMAPICMSALDALRLCADKPAPQSKKRQWGDDNSWAKHDDRPTKRPTENMTLIKAAGDFLRSINHQRDSKECSMYTAGLYDPRFKCPFGGTCNREHKALATASTATTALPTALPVTPAA
jgi:hypothetical protein